MFDIERQQSAEPWQFAHVCRPLILSIVARLFQGQAQSAFVPAEGPSDPLLLVPDCRSQLAQMGSIGRPMWMSTGIYDVDVTPSYVKTLSAQIKQVCP